MTIVLYTRFQGPSEKFHYCRTCHQQWFNGKAQYGVYGEVTYNCANADEAYKLHEQAVLRALLENPPSGK